MYWAKTNGIKIDTAVLFIKLAIENTLNKKFKPGGPVAMYESVESGISPLMAIPRNTQEIEKDIRRKEAAAEPKGTRNQAEAIQTKKTYPRRPPRNWY